MYSILHLEILKINIKNGNRSEKKEVAGDVH